MTRPTSSSSHGCAGFSRAELLRAGAARAGDGLRAIEPGMPAPAGTGLSRRTFLARGAGLALAVYGGRALAPQRFEEGIAAAQAAGSPDAVLVSVFLPGGMDSLSMLAPVGDPAYAALRPTLKAAPDAALTFAEDHRLQWHPALAPLRDLHAAGNVTVIPAVGYADPNQSHFTSRHYWEVGATDTSGRVGWLGRYLDQHGTTDNPLQGLSLDSTLAPALATAAVPVAAVSQPGRYDLWARDVWDPRLFGAVVDGWGGLGRLATGDAELASARHAAAQSVAVRAQLAPLQDHTGPWQSAVAYPAGDDPFPARLAALAEMLGRGLPLKVVALDANGGYDTHNGQAAALDRDFDLLARSLAAFQADLTARGIADRVLVHVWSEFGRRPRENGAGTDHGAGGASLLIGSRASGRMVGEFPGLGTLDERDNLRSTTDFRAVYRGLLEQWLGVGADGILPGASSFAAPVLVA